MSDLISREEALHAVEHELDMIDHVPQWVFDRLGNALKGLPSIDVVKHGRWVRTTKADYAWECSVCGYGLCDNRTTYCYDCGARMDGDTDETNY